MAINTFDIMKNAGTKAPKTSKIAKRRIPKQVYSPAPKSTSPSQIPKTPNTKQAPTQQGVAEILGGVLSTRKRRGGSLY